MGNRTMQVTGLVLREDGAQTRPVFLCQYCGDEIDEANMAMFYWDTDSETSAYSAHKRCDVSAGLPDPMSMELDIELIYLLRNSGMDDTNLGHAAGLADIMGSL